MEDKNEWRQIEGFEGYYQVNNDGIVRSIPRWVSNHTGVILLKSKIMKQALNHKGYPVVYLSKNGKCYTKVVHRLVAKAFIPNPDPINKTQVNHIDGIKTNNNVKNLEWCNNSDNQLHAVHMGLNDHSVMAKKLFKKVAMIDPKTDKVLKVFNSIKEAARETNQKSPSNIGGCCRNIYGRKTVGGYKWKYVEEKEEVMPYAE